MSRVLFLGYYFPPLGGAGVQRNVKFLKYLPELGFESLVVAGPDDTSLSWAPPDRTLAADVPAGTDVVRIEGPEPPFSDGWRGRAERWLRLRSAWSSWLLDGFVRAGRDAAGEFDLIYASMAPWEAGEAAALLSQESGKPWVADLQDPWALDDWMVFPSGVHRACETARMRRVLGRADAIVLNVPEAALEVRRRFPELRDTHIAVVPNGYDAADFDGPAPEREDECFRIVHTGYVHATAGRSFRRTRRLRRLLGGAAPGLDVLTRSHVYLLEAIELLLARRPELRARIEVHLAGVLSPSLRAELPSQTVHAHGYVAHPDAVALMRSADLLFLPMHDLAPGVRARTVPGKTYEYLASGRPILGALPDGDARDLLVEAGSGLLCRPADIDAMAELIAQRVEAPSALPPNDEVVARYERRELSRLLAGVFAVVLRDGSELEPELLTELAAGF